MKKFTLFATIITVVVTGIFIGCDSDSSSVSGGGGGGAVTKNIVIIYDTSRTNAQKFKNLLVEAGYNENLIDLMSFLQLESPLTSLSGYRLIMINPDAINWGGDTIKYKTIKNSNRPVFGIGKAGAILFDSLKLNIGWGNSAGMTNDSQVRVVDSNNTIWKTPYNLNVKTGDSLTLYTKNVYSNVLYAPPGPSLDTLVTLIGRSRLSTYYHLVCERKYFLWGFTGSASSSNGHPDSLTTQGKKLFINAVAFMMTK